jgi:hypothetical protein
MKKFSLFTAFIFVASLVFAQVQTIHNPNAKATVTQEQINANAAHSPKSPASTIVLNFEGLGNLAPVLNYYDGGAGPNYGVAFNGTTLAIIDQDAGGSGNFANEPSPNTIMFFLSGNAIMNVAAGFTTGFSYYYSSNGSGVVYVYDGLNGTGNLLATQPFGSNYNINCTGDPNGAYCHWDAVGVSFAGTAKSVEFTGVQNYCGFDDVTFGSVTPGPGPGPSAPIPTLGQWGLIFLGLALLGLGTVYILKMRG